ncbi:hypothetical protein LY13_002651 [Prauserella aidingensis]|nr:hypothetical protein [Prauserella aidingensis]
MNRYTWEDGTAWWLEAFRESDELLEWKVCLENASRPELESILGIAMETPVGYDATVSQVKLALEKFYSGAVDKFGLDGSKFSFCVSAYKAEST